MTTQTTTKGHPLRVIQVEEGNFYVESSEGKIAYKVRVNGAKPICTCADFTSNKAEQCKHILAVLNRPDNGKPKLDDRFKMEIGGKEFVLYAGLLDLAHQLGIEKIEVDAVQFPTKENGSEAICKAMVATKKGEVFVEWGDANPNNTNKKITPHILRMAATRAKARALRDYTNIGMTCLEELGDLDDVVTEKKPSTRKTTPKSDGVDPQKSANGETNSQLSKQPQKSANGETQRVNSEPPKRDRGDSQKSANGTKDEHGLPNVQAKAINDSVKLEPQKSANGIKNEHPTSPRPSNAETKDFKTSVRQESQKSANGPVIFPKPSEAQMKAIQNLAQRRGVSPEELEKLAQQQFKTPLHNLTSNEASGFIRYLQQAA